MTRVLITYGDGGYDCSLFVCEDNWILLVYEAGGEDFHTQCTNENRRTTLMIICKPGESLVLFRVYTANKLKFKLPTLQSLHDTNRWNYLAAY